MRKAKIPSFIVALATTMTLSGCGSDALILSQISSISGDRLGYIFGKSSQKSELQVLNLSLSKIKGIWLLPSSTSVLSKESDALKANLKASAAILLHHSSKG